MRENGFTPGSMNEIDGACDVKGVVVAVVVFESMQVSIERILDACRQPGGDEFFRQMPASRRFSGADSFEPSWIEPQPLLEQRLRHRGPSLFPLILQPP